jgi:dipeptidyl aminopeptidase/acylaminoacyl peptidase
MNQRTRALWAAIALLLFAGAAVAQQPQRRAIKFEDLVAMHRVMGPQISPDAKWIAYEVAIPDLAANKVSHDIWIVATAGGESRQVTRGGSDTRPRWSPDGKKLAFLSARDGTQQIYWIGPEGGEATRVTSLSTGADNELWSPDGKWLAFVSRVYPDCKDDACNAQRDAAKEKSKVKARLYDRLMVRHWNEWWDGKRSHLFVMASGGGSARDQTPGADYDVPPFNLGDPEAIGFSPDSQEICFTANTDKNEALSTNGDLFTMAVTGSTEPKRITSNPGNDWGPTYSPDGKWIAYRAQMQPGYESDRWRLMLYERKNGKLVNVTDNFDRSVESFAWAPDSKTLYFQAEDKAEMPIFSIAASAGNTPKVVLGASYNPEFDVSRDGRVLAFTRTSMAAPAEVFVANSEGSEIRQVTHQNGALLAQLELPLPEPFWFVGADGTQVEGLMVRPPHFDEAKKYPMLLLIHGGPQQMWADSWSNRWNPEVLAAPGYVAVMINVRGSPGYGQKFTAEITHDWGGKVYEDLMKGVDAALAKFPFIDGSRMAAAGGSYGGYMVDWIATHSDRFKCLISHAGSYDEVSMYATEELWFQEWEFGGPPWSNPELYKKWSAHEYAGALGKYKTPTLVVAGELDFRVPYTQSLEFFDALQRQEVPSELLIFPDEGHWVLKPANSELWHKTFHAWLAKYLK